MSIRKKLLALLLPFVLLPLLGLSWSNYTGLHNEIHTALLTEAESALAVIAQRLELNLRSAMASVQQLQDSLVVQKYAAQQDRQLRAFLLQPSLLASFLSHTQNQPDYLKIAYVNRDDEEEAQVGQSRRRDPEPTILDAVRSALRHDGKPVGVFVPDLEGKPRLIVAAPIKSDIKRPGLTPGHEDVLIVQLALEGIQQQMKAFAARYGSIAAIGSHHEILLEAGMADQASPEHTLVLKHDLDNLVPGFMLQANADPGIADSRGRPAFIQALFLTIFTLMAAGLLFYRILDHLVIGPIRALTSAAETIATGDLDIDLSHSSNDELGELTQSMRNMAAELKNSKQQADHLAFHDHLTGLPNRRFFMTSLENALLRARHHGTKLALLFLDLDEFKQINDVHGHDVGDQVLVTYGNRLRQSIRAADLMGATTISRMGGDEFFVLLDPIATPIDAAGVAQRLLTEFDKAITAGHKEHHISVSVGIATHPEDGASAEELIKHADIALYHAKDSGKNNYQFYSNTLNLKARRRASIAAGLRHAVLRNELTLVYQPQIDLRQARIVGAEALLRWSSPELGEVLPGEFIPIAAETGTINEIGSWVIRKACEDCKDCLRGTRRTAADFKIAVNVSAAQLRTPEAIEDLLRTVHAVGTSAKRLEIEITESEAMRDPDRYSAALREVSSLGVSIALDDFGTGYSSFSYLRKLPLDVLKIDRSLTEDLPENRDATAIILAILTLGRNLGLKTVAEGIETSAQARILKHEGCNSAQGFHYHRPVERNELLRLLDAQDEDGNAVELPFAPSRV